MFSKRINENGTSTRTRNGLIMDVYNRKAIFESLSEYCVFADKDAFIEVCEWHNGEGFDVEISSKLGDNTFSLTWGEYDAMIHLTTKLSQLPSPLPNE